MRITEQQRAHLKNNIIDVIPDADIYLFGSRTNDELRGGDIDILIVADRRLTFKEIWKIQFDFQQTFGDQKIDVVSFTHNEDRAFKDVALKTAIAL